MGQGNRARKIMLIRHSEKPSESDKGVSPMGIENGKSLSVRGWQRAGALTIYFRAAGQQDSVATPQFLFASHSSSLRPQYTLLPLAEKLGVAINLDYGKGDEDRLITAAAVCDGTVLICWQHDYMTAVANRVLGENKTAPQKWPSERFDVTWIFDLDPFTSGYRFSQVPQRLLSGDSDRPI